MAGVPYLQDSSHGVPYLQDSSQLLVANGETAITTTSSGRITKGCLYFAIVSVASVLSLRDDKIWKAAVVLGAVAPIPLRAADVEHFLVGREPDTDTAEAAGVIAVRTACPVPKNAFKAQIVRAMLREAVLDLHCSGIPFDPTAVQEDA